MRKPKLIEDYHRLQYDEVSPLAHSVVRQTETSSFLTNGKALTERLAEAVADLDADVKATDHPTPAQTARRDELRNVVLRELGRLAKRLNLDYPANEPALLSSGLTLVESSSAGTAQKQPLSQAIMNIELVDGSQSGCVLVKLARPTGTVQNLLRYSTDSKLPEEHWLVATGGGRERQLGPFESGTKVFVKAAALMGSTTEPQYSTVKARIVQ